jgi:hypothetical protein
VASATESQVEALLRDLDQQVDNAIAEGIEPPLRRILAPDFIYTHSTEHSDPIEPFIAWVQKPRNHRPQRLLSEVNVEVHGDIAVTRGNLDIVYVDAPRKLLRYVRVYRHAGEEWRLISSRTVLADDRYEREPSDDSVKMQ